MNNSQQLFEINKRINQIKRNLSLRSEKACQWSVPYEKILKKSQTSQNTQQRRSLYSKQILRLYKTKEEQKFHLQQKVKLSRQKIKNFHNQLKELQQLQQRKTKLHVKKENFQQTRIQNENSYSKRNSSVSNQLKTMSKIFNSPMLTSTILSKTMSHSNLRTLKDRVNPFMTMKPEKIVEIFQEAKHSGKENVINQVLGMGLEFTPYSHVLKKDRKDEDPEQKILMQNNSVFSNEKKVGSLQKNDQEKHKMNHLQKILGSKVEGHKEIYCKQPDANRSIVNSRRELRKSKTPNMFEQRMKKLIEETNAIQDCEGNYIEMLRKKEKEAKAQRRMSGK